MKEPLISVLIPVYNHERYIGKAIESVLQQSYRNIEVIISDDCSSDRSREIIREYAAADERIIVLDNKINLGICGNFNQLFDKAAGEYIAFFSGDDIMLPGKLERQLAILRADPRIAVVHHNAWVIDEQGSRMRLHQGRNLPLFNPLDWALRVDWFHVKKIASLLPTTCLARSDYYLRARYDARLRYKHELLFTIEDYCHEPAAKWHYIEEPLSLYRMHEKNFTNNPAYTRFIAEEGFKLPEMAKERCPALAGRSEAARLFFLYERIIFDWFTDEEEKKNAVRYFSDHAPLRLKVLLRLAKWALRCKLYWPLSRLLRGIYRPFYLRLRNR
jgi:glycosyltransferase involved in cell wall biosynthesis